MFTKRALALVAMAVMATSSAFAQEVDVRELQLKQNTNSIKNAGPSNPLWPGPRVIKGPADVVALAERWRLALVAGWQGVNPVNSQTVKPGPVLAQYAPDGLKAYKSKGNFNTGSVLLPTVSGTILSTDALRLSYFQNTFLPGSPNPDYVGPFVIQQLSKDVVTLAGNWNYNSTSGANPKQARVLVVWKKYPKVVFPDGTVSKNHWLISSMHSSPRNCSSAINSGTCTVL